MTSCKSQFLEDVGIRPGTLLTVMLTAESQIFEYHAQYEYDGAMAQDQSRVLLGNGCFLVRKQFDPDDCTGSETRPMQWDILYGSYEIEDGVATCSWDVHLQRKIDYDLGLTEKLGDSGWQKMEERASFKWRRLEVSDRTGTSLLEEKLASMTLEELEKAMQEDMRSNGVEENDIYSNEDFLGDEQDVNKLCENLMKLYRGEGLSLDYGARQDTWSALIPGRLLGLSHCWTRLREYEEQLACEESPTSVPGLDFSQSCLLGIKLTENISDEKALDLSELPRLLGL